MGEKRKPLCAILLKITGNRNHKIELFDKSLFSKNDSNRYYRIRVDGKWFPPVKEVGKKYYRSYEIRDLVWKSLHKALTAQPITGANGKR